MSSSSYQLQATDLVTTRVRFVANKSAACCPEHDHPFSASLAQDHISIPGLTSETADDVFMQAWDLDDRIHLTALYVSKIETNLVGNRRGETTVLASKPALHG